MPVLLPVLDNDGLLYTVGDGLSHWTQFVIFDYLGTNVLQTLMIASCITCE